MSESVEARTPDRPVILSDVASSLLSETTTTGGGNAAVTLTPTKGGAFTQTLIALRSGNQLDPGHWNGPASVQVVIGAARVDDDGEPITLGAGGWTELTSTGAAVTAEEDAVVLLTVALTS